MSTSRRIRRKLAHDRAALAARRGAKARLGPVPTVPDRLGPVPAAPHRLNAYRCRKCDQFTVTIDIHQGTTPANIVCRAPRDAGECGGVAASMFYPPLPWPEHAPAPIPAWEWYAPDTAEAERLRNSPLSNLSDYVTDGGLLLRRRTTTPALAATSTESDPT